MLLEGDGEGARVVLRALEDLAGLLTARPSQVTNIDTARTRRQR
jgi:hypothetical protein